MMMGAVAAVIVVNIIVDTAIRMDSGVGAIIAAVK